MIRDGMEPIGVLADIHGNIWALEAVLADARRRGITQFVNLGDTLYGPLAPAETADRLMALHVTSVRGNQDRLLLAAIPNPSRTYARTEAALTPAIRAWLGSHPATATIAEEIFLCHGTPVSDEDYLLETPTEQGGRLKPVEAIAEALQSIVARVILCGHSHLPRTVQLPDGRLAVNPGSVGLPAYWSENPPHRMEAGSPHARYAVLARTPDGWRVEQIAVAYMWENASRCAKQNGRDDWAASLLTGRIA